MSSMTSEAMRMLEGFVSVGAARFDVVQTTMNKEGRGRWQGQSPSEARRLIERLLDDCALQRLNLIIFPRVDPPSFLIQLDDLSAERLEQIRFLAFLVIQTSPGGHQAWLAVEGCDASFCKRVKKAVGADLGATGWVRVTGSFNFKKEHGPNFPIVRIVAIREGLKVTPARLHALGLVAELPPPSHPAPALSSATISKPKRFPDYRRFLDGAPERTNGHKDRSLADFTFCCACLRWGFTINETAAQLMREPLSKAAERGEGYASYTAKNAAAAVGIR